MASNHPANWRQITLGETAVINPEQVGREISPDEVIAYLDIASIETTGSVGELREVKFKDAPSRARRRARHGDIIVSTVRPYLRAFALLSAPPPNAVVSTGFAVVRPLDPADSDFLYQNVLDGRFVAFLEPRMKGSSYPAVGASDVAEYPLLMPPPPERRKIAAILSSVDEAIAKTQAVIEQVRVVKKGLMQELLTRGLPGRHIRFKQTEMGEVPEEWKVVTLGELIAHGPDNGLYKPKTDYGSGAPIVRIDGFANGDILPHTGYQRVRATEAEIARYQLCTNDLLINRVNSLSHLAKTAFVAGLAEPSIFESNMMRFHVEHALIDPKFAFYVISSDRSRRHFLDRAKRAVAQASVNQEDVKSLPVALPGSEEQRAIAAGIDSVNSRLHAATTQRQQLEQVKQALISVLLTGEVRVKVDEAAA
jgi:type I restriction enzyme, S subunit